MLADDAERGRSATANGSASERGLAFKGRPTDRRFFAVTRFRPLSAERYRISVKIEPKAAGTYVGMSGWAMLSTSSPRGSFILQPGERPVVLLSAGIGATPVLAMYALAAAP